MTTARFITLNTRQYTAPEAEVANSKARELRAEDLNGYGGCGYEMQSTVVVPQEDGIVIIDTLSRVQDD